MSWAEEAMKEHASVESRDSLFTDANVISSTTSTSWDPHEVWLTRVKQPRERLASRFTSNAESQVPEPAD